MATVAENPRAVAGNNNPPAFVAFERDVEDLHDEARNFLDGSPIENEGQAESVARLLDSARKVWKAADEQRRTEKRPHDDAAQAVQDTWNPLLTKAKRVEIVAKAAQTAWLTKVEDEQRRRAEEARVEADRLQREAQAAHAAAQGDNLDAREAAEDALKLASKASKEADKLDKARPLVASGGRSIGLRRVYRTEVNDMAEFARWAWVHRREEYEVFLTDLAEREGRRGPVSIPGITIHTKREAR